MSELRGTNPITYTTEIERTPHERLKARGIEDPHAPCMFCNADLPLEHYPPKFDGELTEVRAKHHKPDCPWLLANARRGFRGTEGKPATEGESED